MTESERREQTAALDRAAKERLARGNPLTWEEWLAKRATAAAGLLPTEDGREAISAIRPGAVVVGFKYRPGGLSVTVEYDGEE